jgi:hypothetical protein
MNNTILNKVSVHIIVLVFVAMFFSIATAFGQTGVNMTKIKDGSVPNSEVTASKTAVLELESVNKGFLLPRLTNSQRNAISIVDRERGNGLTIYNIDTDCVNYWSKKSSRWLSLCGTLPPATLEILDCTNIYLETSTTNKKLKQGEYLKDTDLLYMTVSVKEAGTYNISATTDNGYSFSRSGTFNTTGIFTISLEGIGTPLAANETIGDLVKFTINGNENGLCNNFRILVESSALTFTITSQDILASWKAYIGVPLTASNNTIKVKVKVTNKGYWQIASEPSVVNGMSFNGSGVFNSPGEYEVELIGQGTPKADTPVNQPTEFTFRTNSTTGDNPSFKLKVQVLPVDFEMVCDNAAYPVEFRGEYKEDTEINRNNAILIPIKVKAPGYVAEMSLNGKFIGNGINLDVKYIAREINLTFNSARDNIQYVIFYPEKTQVIKKGVTSIKFTSITPASANWCGDIFPEIKVIDQKIRYNVLCNSVRVFGNYNTETELSAMNFIELTVNVDYPGEYDISTNLVNGVKFSAKGTFSGQGQQTIKLFAEGKYHTGGYINYTITTNSAVGNTSCSATVDVREREIVILTLGNVNYGASPTANTYAGSAILKSTKNFGPNGTVKVNNIRVLSTGLQGEALRSYLINNKVDVIHNVIGYNATDATLTVFDWFVRTEKGVLIISDENTVARSTQTFIERLIGGKSIGSANGRFTMVNPVLSSASNDQIIKGPFGDLNGKYIGNDAHNGWYYDGVVGLQELVPLISKNGSPREIWGLRHRDLGFAFFGDGGWPVGTLTNTSTNIWPSKYLTDGTPIAKSYDGGYQVYNSVLYANLMAWAIDYVKKNKPIK